jgi:hypothetical protein
VTEKFQLSKNLMKIRVVDKVRYVDPHQSVKELPLLTIVMSLDFIVIMKISHQNALNVKMILKNKS